MEKKYAQGRPPCTRPDPMTTPRSGALPGRARRRAALRGEIVVDPDAQDAYLRLQHPLAAKLRRVLRVDSEGDTYFIADGRALPVLCADGLCELQRTLGETEPVPHVPGLSALGGAAVRPGGAGAITRVPGGRAAAARAHRTVALCLRPAAGRRLCARRAGAAADHRRHGGARPVLALLAQPGHTAEKTSRRRSILPVRRSASSTGTALRRWPPGKVPAVPADALPEPETPAVLAAAFASPEPLDARWPEWLRRVAALPACPPPRMTAVQQTCLAQAIVWRHGMDALDDRDVVFPCSTPRRHCGCSPVWRR